MTASNATTLRSATSTLVVVSAAAFLAGLDLFIVNIAFPDIRSAFGQASLGAMSWILNAYTLMFAAFLAPAGRLGDRYGHRPVFLWGVGVFLAGSLLCGLSVAFPMLVAARVIQALGAAMVMPSSLALLLAAVSARQHAAAVSVWSAVGAMAAALGPPVGGLLVGLSWRWIFLVNVPVAVLALGFGRVVLPRIEAKGSGVPDLLGAFVLVTGVSALVWVLVELPTAPSSAVVAVVTAIGVLSLFISVWRSRRHPVPALDLVVIRHRPMWLSSVAMLLFAAGFAAMLLCSVMLFTGVWHQSPLRAGLWLSPGPLVVVLVSLGLAGRLIDRFGTGAVAAAGSSVYALGIGYWMIRVGHQVDYVHDFLPGQMLTGIGVGLVLPSLSAVTALALPDHQWGAGSALTNTARQLGAVLGTAILTMVLQSGVELSTIRNGWFLIAAAAASSAFVSAVVVAHGGLSRVRRESA
ncbi:MFS transporter [Mycolicibacterium sp. 018/SC-01/001]|uniref:MFS transporter n=1 Tax=Mycolicibacterium sp. 018/SC-01/001 TaxID=2592069 RepID=UPI001180ACA0|nr:MFS transporter [Mycolicibacterium sp. 018/SC-01/001]TRW89166.1 MFS transporter [Mycolicibacterium sp. 018/SC-01/001]